MKKSIFTDKKDIAILIKAGKKKKKKAIQENIDLGLKNSFEKSRNSPIKSSLNIKKGTILYVKSKQFFKLELHKRQNQSSPD